MTETEPPAATATDAETDPDRETSQGTLLGGRIRYRQPRCGFRSGIEPVLLAAAVPAEAQSCVLEGGTGAGAGLLCLAARVAGVRGIGVERDSGLAALARANFAGNGFASLTALAADVRALAPTLAADATFDHAFANPPWHGALGTEPAHPARRAAKREGERLQDWIVALAGRLERRGTLTLILPAAELGASLAATKAAGLGEPRIFPLWPRQQRPAKLVLVQQTRGARGPLKLLAGLVLHRPDGRFTEQAEAVLRSAAALTL
ncbi:MAG: tRNA1(Val) (adenine(37)-N6)-methyltransferase [Acetobacteraceae bacterium]